MRVVSQRQKPSRQHHHVWQHYLKPWTDSDGAIWCRQDGKAVFATGTPVVAVEKDFYRLHDLTPQDLAIAKLLFSKSPPEVQQLNNELVAMLMRPFTAARRAERAGDMAMRAVMLQLAEHWAMDALEAYHAGVEAQAIPLLDLALAGDLSFYDDQRAIGFCYFLAIQHMRTKGVKERTIELCKADGSADLTRLWNVLVPMFGTSLGWSFYRDRRKSPLTLIRNDTDVPFITGDQPTINVLAAGYQRGRPPERLSQYYPIAPRLALLIPEEDQPPLFPAEGLTRDQANALNAMVAEAAHRQLFGPTRESLAGLPIPPEGVAPTVEDE
jgi:hypothetical protein